MCGCVCLELKTPPPPELEISFCPGKQRRLQYLNICHFLAGICLTGSRQTESQPTKQLRTKKTIVENSNEPTHAQWWRNHSPQSDCLLQPFLSLPGGCDGYRGAELLLRGGLLCLAKFTKANVAHLFPVSNHESVLFFTAIPSAGFSLGEFQYFRC